MRRLVALSSLLASAAFAAVTLDRDFWDNYLPYQQYPEAMIPELFALQEGDLLATARDIDGLEIRVVGRSAPYSKLVSARLVSDSVAMQRLQVKLIPYSLSPNASRQPASYRRLVTMEQARALTELLDRWDFWDAPYNLDRIERDDGLEVDCSDAGAWIVEAYKPATYQIISRSNCEGLDPAVAEIRDFLLGLAGVSADGAD